MTSIRTLLMVSVCTLSLAACDFLVARDRDEPAPVETEAPDVTPDETATLPDDSESSVMVASIATIDWDTARADLAATPTEQRQTSFQVADGHRRAARRGRRGPVPAHVGWLFCGLSRH